MDFTLVKPNIETTKILTKSEKILVEDALKNQGRKLIHIELKPSKNDYIDDHFRGTVEYTPKCRNYSFHKVIIPDGTTIKESNLTQRDMNTFAISGKNLTFIECNLANNVIAPTWILEGCLVAQVDFTKREVEELARIEAEKVEVK